MRFIALIFCFMVSWSPWASAELLYLDQRTEIDPTADMLYLVDAEHSMSVTDVNQADFASWLTPPTNGLQFGFDPRTFWLRLAVRNVEPHMRHWYLELANPLVEHAELYLLHTDSGEIHGPIQPIDAVGVSFSLPLQPNQEVELYLKLRTKGSAYFPLQLRSEHAFVAHRSDSHLGYGILFGTLLMMALYNMLLFFATRLRSHIYYAGLVSCGGLLLATLSGYSHYYLWSGWSWLQHHAVPILGPAVLIFAGLFAETLLQLQQRNRRLLQLSRTMILLSVACMLLNLFLPYRYAVQLAIFTALPVALSFFITGICLWWRQRYAVARPYTLAWSVFLIGVLWSLALYTGVAASAQMPAYMPMLWGAGAEVLLLAGSLAWQFKDERQARITAQFKAEEQARRMRMVRDKAVNVQNQANEDLERKVRERTLELEIAYRELQEAHDKLEELNTQDFLSGVKNRQFFDKRYLAELRRSRREQTTLSVLMIDIDHFKHVNDTYGHLAGDECIKAMANAAAPFFKRPADLFARYGGEEFAALLPGTNEQGALLVAESIRSAIEQMQVTSAAGKLSMTVSIGVASLMITSATEKEVLLARADEALYQAKRSGRNKVVAYQQEESDHV